MEQTMISSEQMTIQNWAKIAGADPKTLPTQLAVKFSEAVELIFGIIDKDPQEIMDGLVDVDWMVNMNEYLINHEDADFATKLNLQPELDKLLAKVAKHYPGLLEEYYENFKHAVLVSNFSKFSTNMEEMRETTDRYMRIGVKTRSISTNVDGAELWVHLSSEDQHDNDGNFYPEGKILKSVRFEKPQLKVEYRIKNDFEHLNRKIDKKEILGLIAETTYHRVEDSTMTLCRLRLKNSTIVHGESACINPDDFDEKLGKESAFNDALDKLWELEGYHRKSLLAM